MSDSRDYLRESLAAESRDRKSDDIASKVIADVMYDIYETERLAKVHHIEIMEIISQEIPLNPNFRATIEYALKELKKLYKQEYTDK